MKHGILIVEDEPLVRLAIADDFEDEGFEVYLAGSSDEAIEVLESELDIDIVFADIRIPGKYDGAGLLDAVCQRWPHMALMATSGHPDPSQNPLPDEARFIAKPFLPSDAVSQARALIAERGQ